MTTKRPRGTTRPHDCAHLTRRQGGCAGPGTFLLSAALALAFSTFMVGIASQLPRVVAGSGVAVLALLALQYLTSGDTD